MAHASSEPRRMKLSAGDVEELRKRVAGSIVLVDDDGYEAARHVWNGVIDRRPALIVQCTGPADVIAAVDFARDRKLPASVRGGGHNVAGTAVCDDGVVIDLSRMHGVRVDPIRKTARVEGGATLGRLDHEAQAFGLAAPAGLMSETGIAGLTLHGGLGFLTRRLGLTCDNLVAADVVTADGRLVVADEMQNSDLLWALRGGGGNFGVVTSFEFKLHSVGPEVWMGLVMYPAADAPRLLSFFRDFMAKAPDELMAIAVFWNTPHDESVPEAARNQPTLVFGACWSGPMEEGEAAVRPLREAGTPFVDLSGPMPFVDAQKLFDPEYPNGRRYYWKSIYLGDLNDGTIESLAALSAARPSPISSLDIWALGGAMARVPADHGAFRGRVAPFLLGIEANWDDAGADEVNIAWARRAFREMEQRFPEAGAYLNFAGFAEEGDKLLKRSFEDNLARLQAIKAKYDPENFFRSNLNIVPRHAVVA